MPRTNIPIEMIDGAGTAAALDVGTGANSIPQLNGSGQLPAIDISLGTGITTPTVFTSTPTAFAFGDTKTFAHGLASAPDIVQLYLKCVSAEHGYTAVASSEDIILVDSRAQGQYNANRGFSVYLDQAGATNIIVEVSTNAPVIISTSGLSKQITAANWEIIVKAVVFA